MSVVAAFLAVGAVHLLSGRGIWGVFPSAYQVRQLSVYLLDAIPFYLIAVYLVSVMLVSTTSRLFLARNCRSGARDS